jgi:hypothetical protein
VDYKKKVAQGNIFRNGEERIEWKNCVKFISWKSFFLFKSSLVRSVPEHTGGEAHCSVLRHAAHLQRDIERQGVGLRHNSRLR